MAKITTAAEAKKFSWRAQFGRPFKPLNTAECARLDLAEKEGFFRSCKFNDLAETAWWSICANIGRPVIVVRGGKGKYPKILCDHITASEVMPNSRMPKVIAEQLELLVARYEKHKGKGEYGVYTLISVAPEKLEEAAAAFAAYAKSAAGWRAA